MDSDSSIVAEAVLAKQTIEEKVLKFWDEINLSALLLQLDERRNVIHYDGPPFATGMPHYGHLLAMMLKDTSVKWKMINGLKCVFPVGWDCHGLPIEFEIDKKLGIKTKEQVLKFGIKEYNAECRQIVLTYVKEWYLTFKRIGRWVNPDENNSYKTMDIAFMNSVWRVFKIIYDKGLIEERYSVMPYSIGCTTTLSNFEASSNYKNIDTMSIIIKFELLPGSECISVGNSLVGDQSKKTYFLCWTTTPWTIPAHYSICVNSLILYAIFEYREERYIVAKTRIDYVLSKIKAKKEEIIMIEEIAGAKLVGQQYAAPYNYVGLKTFAVIEGGFVSDDDGTGLVHCAPAYGVADFDVCLKAGLITHSQVYIHIDDNGYGYQCGPVMTGIFYQDMNKIIIGQLRDNNMLFASFNCTHSYPFCWRSDTPLIYIGRTAWFLKVEDIKDELVKLNASVNWVPEHIGKTRFHNWLKDAHSWCISRNRYWGNPIPIFQGCCPDGSKKNYIVSSLEELEYLTKCKIHDLHIDTIDKLVFELDGVIYKRIPEVFDCWFESGAMPFAIPSGYKGPAEFIAEGIDQTRGWFYTLLVIGYILTGESPYKNVIANGLVLAEDGKKMSKKLKNYPDPNELINDVGADALRLYLIVSGAAYGEPLKLCKDDVKLVLQTITIPLQSTFRFYEDYMKLFLQHNSNKHNIQEEKEPINTWILYKTDEFLQKYSHCMNSYNFHPIGSLLLNYINTLNNQYIKINRDNLKGKYPKVWKQSLHVLETVLLKLFVFLSPILPFLCEHLFQLLKLYSTPDVITHPLYLNKSVHLCDLTKLNIITSQQTINKQELNDINKMMLVIDMVRSIRNTEHIQNTKPLKEVIVYMEHVDESFEQYKSLIMNEANCVELIFANLCDVKYELVITVDKQKAGKALKKDLKKFEEMVSLMTQHEILSVYEGKPLQDKVVDLNLVNIAKRISLGSHSQEQNEHKYLVDNTTGITIQIDTTWNQELEERCIARLIAKSFQEMRKAEGYHVSDNVILHCLCLDNVANIIKKYNDIIVKTTQVPVNIINSGCENFTRKKNIVITNHQLVLYITKI
jgi:isoleucyl-tRNA synthetase